MKLTIAVQAYSGALVQFQQGGFGSRHGEPAPEGSRRIAASGYREKIAAVIPAREYVDGQQVFCGFLMRKAAHTVNNTPEQEYSGMERQRAPPKGKV